MPLLLKDQTSEGLYSRLFCLGVSPRQARQLHAAVLRKGVFPDSLPDFPRKLLRTVRDAVEVPNLALVEKAVSTVDDFARYAFRGNGPGVFETVRIPLTQDSSDRKYVVCVSSQVGCCLDCAFCRTGRMGFVRNLSAWEIVDQVVKVRDDSPYPVRGVVFMGMGEPFLNYDNVIRAARILSEPCGLAIPAKSITVSTSGIIPGIRSLMEENLPLRLIVSLSSADPETRSFLMPVEKTYPSSDLFQALREYHGKTGIRVTLAWTMISGVNVSEKEAKDLAVLAAGLPVKLDLIDVNDPDGRFRAPSASELAAFRDHLRTHLRMPVSRRYSGGRDIQAACGLLAGLHGR